MNAQDLTYTEAVHLLAKWAEWAALRDQLVRDAYAARVTKTEIHKLTGLARTTVDAILAEEVQWPLLPRALHQVPGEDSTPPVPPGTDPAPQR